MDYTYTCNSCIATAASKPPHKLSVAVYNQLAAQFMVIVEHGVHETPQVICPTCGASMHKVLSIAAGFIRGYGLSDKRGITNDMNLHKMLTNDPYKEHRTKGDAGDLVGKLRRQKDYNPKSSSVFMG